MTSTNYTIANWNTGISLTPEKGERPAPTPRELIATRAVETMRGWVGQVIIDSQIIWESDFVVDDEDDNLPASASAQQQANAYVIERVKNLFA